MLKVVQANLPEHRVLIFGVSRLNAKQRVFAHSDHMFMHRFQLRMLIPITYNEDGLRMVVETRHRWLAKVRELSGIDWMQITYEPVESVLRKLGCK